MFGFGKFFKKSPELISITNNISETMIYFHKVILSFARGQLPKTYWDQDYICSFYCTLIDHFTEKLIYLDNQYRYDKYSALRKAIEKSPDDPIAKKALVQLVAMEKEVNDFIESKRLSSY